MTKSGSPWHCRVDITARNPRGNGTLPVYLANGWATWCIPVLKRGYVSAIRCRCLPAGVSYTFMDVSREDHHAPQGIDTGAATTPGTRRIIGAATVLGCAAVLGAAALMTPSASGVGTHQQLNLPSCGWITVADMPCMTCGMTTAFSHAVRGEFVASLLAQPFGFLLAMGTAMGLVVGLHTTVTGANVFGMFAGLWRPRTMWLLVAIGLAAWIYKIIAYKGMLT